MSVLGAGSGIGPVIRGAMSMLVYHVNNYLKLVLKLLTTTYLWKASYNLQACVRMGR